MHHHTIEDAHMFPAFKRVKGVKSLQHNIEQHKEFSDGLNELHNHSTSTEPDDYNGQRFCKLIDVFAKPLHQHLTNEIDILWAMDSVPANKQP
ncbi:hypothetical protein K504DRAFT_464015 [Pleomassaria siparia CBS 279.74]|uniref:Hemerythrin-like domain-containing protein n=1 Tax=Pleomassaria siparia CBS 279.74 TaxID=1314801 RepID=A0A6G1JRN6_9PLEO|nr:hypothetical protein K504DRAFT_464015 [Pleomassaria siparia CBS 279.74]